MKKCTKIVLSAFVLFVAIHILPSNAVPLSHQNEGVVQAAGIRMAAKVIKNGIINEKGKVYYYKSGKKTKNKWVKVGKNKYYLTRNGAAAIGWNKISEKAYFFYETGIMAKSKKIDGIKVNANGAASLQNERVKMKFQAMAIMSKQTRASQSATKKLKNVYNYIVKSSGYLPRFFPTTKTGWEVTYALDMLTTKKGNCYSYAAAFAMLASESGYDVTLIKGTMTKTGESEREHAWVEIAGKVYDPQSQATLKTNLYNKTYKQITTIKYKKQKAIKIAMAQTKKAGLVLEKDKYSFYQNGKKVKSKWIDANGARFYFDKNGIATVGAKKISGKLYLFGEKGKLLRSAKNKTYTVKGKKYLVSPEGIILTGWQLVGNKLYYYNKSRGTMNKNQKMEGIELSAQGEAVETSNRAKLKIQVLTLLPKLVNDQMSKTQKLRACYNYVVNANGYHTWRQFTNYSDWVIDYALEFLVTGRGNCYNFAAAFAVLAKECGYNVSAVRGRVPGSRDGAADGYTRHSWVIVDGLHYDPEAEFAGFKKGVFGYPAAPSSYRIESTKKL
jgi:glucan-binding YG repeat protein